MVHSWNDYVDYEKRNRKNKEENIQGRELIIALSNELNRDHDKLAEDFKVVLRSSDSNTKEQDSTTEE